MTHWQIVILIAAACVGVGLLWNISQKMDQAVRLLIAIERRSSSDDFS